MTVNIFVGRRDVTTQFRAAFTGANANALDGNLNEGRFRTAIIALREQVKLREHAAPGSPEAAAIDSRFERYMALTQNDCLLQPEALPVLQGLYEELTHFIEPNDPNVPNGFDGMPDVMQQNMVALEAECFGLVAQRGSHRLAGMARTPARAGGRTENQVLRNPIPDQFRPHPGVLANVPRVTLDGGEGLCSATPTPGTPPRNIYQTRNPGENPLVGPNGISEGATGNVNFDVRFNTIEINLPGAVESAPAPRGRNLGATSAPDPLRVNPGVRRPGGPVPGFNGGGIVQ